MKFLIVEPSPLKIKARLDHKCLRSASDLMPNVLLITIRPSDGDVNPGDPLGVIFDESRLMPALIHCNTIRKLHIHKIDSSSLFFLL